MPRIPGLLERIQQPLYDRGTVLAAGTTTQVNFFQVPLGGGTPAKNELSTNMDQGGSLPYPKNFELHAIRCVNAYAATVADLILIYNNAWFRLFIGTKNYLGRQPLYADCWCRSWKVYLLDLLVLHQPRMVRLISVVSMSWPSPLT